MLLKDKDHKLLFNNKKKKNKFQQKQQQKIFLLNKDLKVQHLQFIFQESMAIIKSHHQIHFLQTLHQKNSIQFNNYELFQHQKIFHNFF